MLGASCHSIAFFIASSNKLKTTGVYIIFCFVKYGLLHIQTTIFCEVYLIKYR